MYMEKLIQINKVIISKLIQVKIVVTWLNEVVGGLHAKYATLKRSCDEHLQYEKLEEIERSI